MAKKVMGRGKGKKYTSKQIRIAKKRVIQKMPISALQNKILYAKNKREKIRLRKELKRKINKRDALYRSNIKRFGTKYPYSKKNIKRTENILRKEKEKQERNERIIKAQEENKVYRYSVAFYSSYLDKTFRAEIYSHTKHNDNVIENHLIMGLNRWISLQNKGLQKNFKHSAYMGVESEMIGSNDLGKSQLGRMSFFID